MSNERLFSVTNHHPDPAEELQFDDAAGRTGDVGRYWGYFENEHGSQFLFFYDPTWADGILYAGDGGWLPHSVREGTAMNMQLSDIEQRWLRACWAAATGDRDPR